jgi:hypothetical protein
MAGWTPGIAFGIRKHVVRGFSYGMQFWIMGRKIQNKGYVKTSTSINKLIENQALEYTHCYLILLLRYALVFKQEFIPGLLIYL